MTTTVAVPSVVDALMHPDDAAWALAGCAPGPEAVAALAMLAPPWLSQSGRVDALRAYERQIAALQAGQQELLAAIAAGDHSPEQWVREDVACALRLSPATVGSRLHSASTLIERLSATAALLAAGEISLRHAQHLADEVAALPAEIAAAVEARVLGQAPGQTLAEFRRSVARAVFALDHAGVEERHEDVMDERRVVITPTRDGMAELWALLPLDRAQTIKACLDARATAMRIVPGGDPRMMDQLRADALVDLALAGLHDVALPTQHGLRPTVGVTVALST